MLIYYVLIFLCQLTLVDNGNQNQPDNQTIEEAFNRGKREAADYFEKMIPEIGMQVFDQASQQLEKIHEESVLKEKELVI